MEVTLLTEEKIKSIFNDVLTNRDDQLIKRFKKELFNDKKLSVEDAANQCGVIPLTIRNWLKKGIIKGGKIGHRVYILQSDLDNALSEVKSLKYKRSI